MTEYFFVSEYLNKFSQREYRLTTNLAKDVANKDVSVVRLPLRDSYERSLLDAHDKLARSAVLDSIVAVERARAVYKGMAFKLDRNLGYLTMREAD